MFHRLVSFKAHLLFDILFDVPLYSEIYPYSVAVYMNPFHCSMIHSELAYSKYSRSASTCLKACRILKVKFGNAVKKVRFTAFPKCITLGGTYWTKIVHNKDFPKNNCVKNCFSE